MDFNFHVKPILSDRCYACHGPDMQNQQADLRLDTPEGAYATLSSGNGVAIKGGSLSGSPNDPPDQLGRPGTRHAHPGE